MFYYDNDKCTPKKLKKECEWIQMILQPLKTAIKGAEFVFDYPEDSMLLTRLTHFGKEILPICDTCRSYRFKIFSYWRDDSSPEKLISTILQFDQIDCCSNVLFEFYNFDDIIIELPVDLVVNWLNRSRTSSAINANGQMKDERILALDISTHIWNVSEMLNCFKKVKFIHLI